MRAVKDSPVTRLLRNNLRMSGKRRMRLGHLARGTRTVKLCSFDTRSGGVPVRHGLGGALVR